jgi:hypothetical protein
VGGPRPVALLAGGTGGLGRSPRALAASGYRFVLLGKTDAHARTAEAAFRDAGAEALGIAADILRDGALADAVARARETFGAAPAAVVWNVGFVPWPAPAGWDPSLLARVARDEARALGSLAAALVDAWRGGEGLIVTVEGHSQERLAGAVPATAVAAAVRGAVLERLRADVPGLVHARVLLGAQPSGPAGEGRWLSQDEIAAAVAHALETRAPRVVAGDLDLAARLAARVSGR